MFLIKEIDFSCEIDLRFVIIFKILSHNNYRKNLKNSYLQLKLLKFTLYKLYIKVYTNAYMVNHMLSQIMLVLYILYIRY